MLTTGCEKPVPAQQPEPQSPMGMIYTSGTTGEPKGEREINSRDLGERVMYELKKLDKIAYIRFASVYRSFSDVEEFRDAIKDLD